MHVFHVNEHDTFYLGENARDNHALTKAAPASSWFFHASHYPSPHGILVTKAATPPQDLARRCADLLRTHTRHATLHVDMIRRKYVRVGPRVGEVVLKRGPQSVWVV